MISTVLPPLVFTPHTMSSENLRESNLSAVERPYVVSVFDSFLIDYSLQRVTPHVFFFFVYGLPIPRLPSSSPACTPIVIRAAKLVCTTPGFDARAAEVGLGSHQNGATDSETGATAL